MTSVQDADNALVFAPSLLPPHQVEKADRQYEVNDLAVQLLAQYVLCPSIALSTHSSKFGPSQRAASSTLMPLRAA
jgi:hypothetical protein